MPVLLVLLTSILTACGTSSVVPEPERKPVPVDVQSGIEFAIKRFCGAQSTVRYCTLKAPREIYCELEKDEAQPHCRDEAVKFAGSHGYRLSVDTGRTIGEDIALGAAEGAVRGLGAAIGLVIFALLVP